jgi:glycosyltransferase involved in cell wall biosynthesis
MKILHVIAPGVYGGLEAVVQSLARGLQNCGQAVTVAVVHRPGADIGEFGSALEAAGVEVAPIPVGGRNYVRERRAIADLCRRLHPDVLHTHGYRPDVVLWGMAGRFGIAHVTTVHGFTGGDWKNRVYEVLQRRVYRTCTAVVAVSRPLADRLITDGVPARRVHVLPNAWGGHTRLLSRQEARVQLGIPADEFTVGWVGRISREKGPDVFLDSLRYLNDLRVRFSVVGEGSESATLRARAAAEGVADRVHWHGSVHDAARYFRAFDAFVLSSRTEGTPIALLEAMAAGIPVVATAVGGVPDMVSSREALLVPPEAPDLLAESIRSVWERPEQAHCRAVAAAQRLDQDFGFDSWVRGYVQLYERLQSSTENLEYCRA